MNIFRRYTLASLKKNRTRTVVTIIGIILSVAMFTAVTTTVSSIRNYMMRVCEQEDGSWNGVMFDLTKEQAATLRTKKDIVKRAEIQNLGYAKLTDSKNECKPFLFLGGMSKGLNEILPVNILEGRLPKKDGEILLPEHLSINGGVKYELGETISLGLGVRKSKDGSTLWQHDSFGMENSVSQSFEKQGDKEYTVVGFYKRPNFEPGMAPGYTAFTVEDSKCMNGETFYFILQDPTKTNQFLKDNSPNMDLTDVNSMYLAYSGFSPNDRFNRILLYLSIILMGIIMFGSISLIYNSFSISVNERKKQFGLLGSIGATKKQMRKSILFESVVLSGVGIPLGVLAGLGGMAITFYCTSDLFQSFSSNATNQLSLHLVASIESILIAAVVGFITVLISAYLPAKKAMKVSAIEAIRQSTDIRITPRKLYTRTYITKLFGLEGTLAQKNFRRNKKKYRATVFSLFISVVLFISASSFCAYMKENINSLISYYNCEINYRVPMKEEADGIFEQFQSLKSATESVKTTENTNISFLAPISAGDRKGVQVQQKNMDNDGVLKKTGQFMIYGVLSFVDDDTYRKFLQKQNLDPDIYMNTKNPIALASTKITAWDSDKEKYSVYQLFDEGDFSIKAMSEKKMEGGYELGVPEYKIDTNGEILVNVTKYDTVEEDGTTSGNAVDSKFVTMDQAYQISNLQVGDIVDEVPMGLDMYQNSMFEILYPQSAMETVLKGNTENYNTGMYFRSDNPDELYKAMCNILTERNLSTDAIQNVYSMVQSNRAILTIMNVFSYGFIILISLIALANVFNTISTNIALRRREFAMLRSVGMTQRGFYKMMNYECVLYGVKGLVYGLPVAFLLTYAIYESLDMGLEQGFFIPWYSILIAVGSVFLVVFATMLYAMNKIRKDNVVETLKNENY